MTPTDTQRARSNGKEPAMKATIILVHGAFADWSRSQAHRT
jgi:hypothetical protein